MKDFARRSLVVIVSAILWISLVALSAPWAFLELGLAEAIGIGFALLTRKHL